LLRTLSKRKKGHATAHREGLFPTLTYSPPDRRTAREIVFAHRNHNDLTPISAEPDGARPRSGARAAPGVARGATGLESPGYAADRYACAVR
jgi:hypothetical protein